MQALYWQRYAELELDEPDPSRAKLVFSRCLLNCPSVKLWSLYLRFIKKVLANIFLCFKNNPLLIIRIGSCAHLSISVAFAAQLSLPNAVCTSLHVAIASKIRRPI